MAQRFSGILDPYDILGKAIPGAVWFFGSFLLLPVSIKIGEQANQFQVKNLTILFLTSVFLGVVFGQGIHTLSRIIEELLGWVRSIIEEITRLVSTGLNYYSVFGIDRSQPETKSSEELNRGWKLLLYEEDFISETDMRRLKPLSILKRAEHLTRGLFERIDSTLSSHRDLFSNYIEARTYFARGEGPDDLRYRLFKSAVEDYYSSSDVDVLKSKDLYPLVTSHLDASPVTRARRFQARYSFTRGMWVTTATFSIVYFAIYCRAYTPSIQGWFDSNQYPVDLALANQILLSGTFLLSLFLIAIVLEMDLRRRVDETSLFTPWLLSALVSLIIVSVLQSINVISFVSRLGLGILQWSLYQIFQTSLVVSDILFFLMDYGSSENIIIIDIFGKTILGVVFFLVIATVAFFDATGSFKRHYIQYMLTDTWESLKGGASGVTEINISEDTIESISEENLFKTSPTNETDEPDNKEKNEK